MHGSFLQHLDSSRTLLLPHFHISHSAFRILDYPLFFETGERFIGIAELLAINLLIVLSETGRKRKPAIRGLQKRRHIRRRCQGNTRPRNRILGIQKLFLNKRIGNEQLVREVLRAHAAELVLRLEHVAAP